jgi:hypothetical protein
MGCETHLIFFEHYVRPMCEAWQAHKDHRDDLALDILHKMPAKSDWRLAGIEWLKRERSLLEEIRGS